MEVSNSTGQNTNVRVTGTGGNKLLDCDTEGGSTEVVSGEISSGDTMKCSVSSDCCIEFSLDDTRLIRWFATAPGRVELMEVEKGVYAIRTP